MSGLFGNFNWKFAALTAALFLAPFLWISRHFLALNNEIIRRETVSFLSDRAGIVARQVQDKLNRNYMLHYVAAQPAFIASGAADRAKTLLKVQKAAPHLYPQLSLLDAAGREKARAGGGAGPLADFSKTDIFLRTVNGGSSVGLVERVAGKPPVLVVSEPVFSGGHALSCVIITRMTLEDVCGIIARARKPSERGETALVDGGGMLVADTRGNAYKGSGALARQEIMALWSDIRRKPARGGTVSLGGRRFLAGFAMVPGTGWFVYDTEPASIISMFAGTARARNMVLLGALAVLLLAVLTERLAAWLVRGCAK